MSPACKIGLFQLIVSLIGLIICTQVKVTGLVYHYRNKKMSGCTICINNPLLFLMNIIILKKGCATRFPIYFEMCFNC